MPEDAGLVDVQIVVADSHQPRLVEVVERLRQAGLQNASELAAIGVVVGRVAPARIESLSRVAGVVSVERSRTVGIPPGEQPD